MKKIALLRGINVGGNRKILMVDLKSMFNELGFSEVTTYIQSGNILFESNEDNSKLSDQIKTAIKDKFGFDVPVVIRSKDELVKAINTNPFYSKDSDIGKLHLTFLQEVPAENDIENLQSIDTKQDEFKIIENNLYIYCEGKYHASKLTNTFIEKKLKVGATTRNWKTVLKLLELCKD